MRVSNERADPTLGVTIRTRPGPLAARRTREAARSAARAETLVTMAGSVLRGQSALPALLERVREAFGMTSATLLERPSGSWEVVDCAGTEPVLRPEDGDAAVPVGDRLALVLKGRSLPAEDRRVLAAFAVQAAVALEQRRLTEVARGGQAARRRRPPAHRAAGRGRSRPAHPAGLGEGRGHEPARR